MLKKFKKNITIDLATFFTEISLCSIPFGLIKIVFIDKNYHELYSFLLVILLLIVFLNICCYLITLISRIFIKTTYIVDDDKLIIQKGNNEQIIEFNKVMYITYDFRVISKNNSLPSTLSLFSKEYKELITIKNPPHIFVRNAKRKCQNAIFKYRNSKRFLVILIIFIITFIFLEILYK